jgi:hypothetical protein
VSTDWAGPDEGWRDVLEDARGRCRESTPQQRAWDVEWDTYRRVALHRGHTPNQAVEIADSRTEAQRGQRPKQETE